MMKTNVGGLDRVGRLVVGVGLVAWAVTGGPVWAWIGVVPILTGALGWCPLYIPFGINTRRKH
jgi:hypothetical protein